MECPDCSKSIPANLSGNNKRCKECWDKLTHKHCSRCKEYLSLDNYYFAKREAGEKTAACKSCILNACKKSYRKVNKNVREYRNPMPINDRKKIYHKQQSDNLTDWYIKKLIYNKLRQDYGLESITHAEIPKELVESTRKGIILYRQVHGKKKIQ